MLAIEGRAKTRRWLGTFALHAMMPDSELPAPEHGEEVGKGTTERAPPRRHAAVLSSGAPLLGRAEARSPTDTAPVGRLSLISFHFSFNF